MARIFVPALCDDTGIKTFVFNNKACLRFLTRNDEGQLGFYLFNGALIIRNNHGTITAHEVVFNQGEVPIHVDIQRMLERLHPVVFEWLRSDLLVQPYSGCGWEDGQTVEDWRNSVVDLLRIDANDQRNFIGRLKTGGVNIDNQDGTVNLCCRPIPGDKVGFNGNLKKGDVVGLLSNSSIHDNCFGIVYRATVLDIVIDYHRGAIWVKLAADHYRPCFELKFLVRVD